jgi:hypothetical protein
MSLRLPASPWAADALKIHKSSVSRSIARLETTLETALLQRTTRKVRLTRNGIALKERCIEILSRINETIGLRRLRLRCRRGAAGAPDGPHGNSHRIGEPNSESFVAADAGAPSGRAGGRRSPGVSGCYAVIASDCESIRRVCRILLGATRYQYLNLRLKLVGSE